MATALLSGSGGKAFTGFKNVNTPFFQVIAFIEGGIQCR
jgi:hypothetical protein